MIRQAAISDLQNLTGLACEFYGASKFLNGFDLDSFEAAWTQLLNSGSAAIFLLDGVDGINGALGCVAYPDINNGELTATEMFWFVSPDARGEGMKLYKEFEAWAKSKACKEIRMVHLTDSMPDKLEIVYRRLGFEEVERHYRKALN